LKSRTLEICYFRLSEANTFCFQWTRDNFFSLARASQNVHLFTSPSILCNFFHSLSYFRRPNLLIFFPFLQSITQTYPVRSVHGSANSIFHFFHWNRKIKFCLFQLFDVYFKIAENMWHKLKHEIWTGF